MKIALRYEERYFFFYMFTIFSQIEESIFKAFKLKEIVAKRYNLAINK